jgi:hypothetical protein
MAGVNRSKRSRMKVNQASHQLRFRSAEDVIAAIEQGDHFMNDPFEDANPKSIEQMLYGAEMREDMVVATH